MSYVEINCRYQELLDRHGLRTCRDFLALSGVIICGHPDRHVASVLLGSGDGAVRALLKREHRVRWKDRLLNACAGFGFVSKSRRECRVLQDSEMAGIGCAEWMATGEDDSGRAFLLVRELESANDLRLHLRDHLTGQPRRRRRFALRLGTALAQFHNAGFEHRDLYSKHIAVDENGAAIHFLDLQRARRRRSVSWAHRWRDLAALEATMPDDVLPQTDRLTCLRAYLRRCRLDGVNACPTALRAAFQVSSAAAPLLAKRRIQESRQAPQAHVIQRLLWLDGEALCVTPEFNGLLQGSLPDWLMLEKMPGQAGQILLDQNITLSNGQPARLIRRRELRFFERLWNGMRGHRLASPELRQSGILFRLERAGLRVPRLMAFGQRYVGARTVESMLLTEAMDGSSLATWGERSGGAQPYRMATDQRGFLIKQAGLCLQQLHRARCYFARRSRCMFVVDLEAAAPAHQRIALAAIDNIVTVRRQNRRLQEANLLALRTELGKLLQSRTDHLRLVCSYLGIRRLNARARRLLGALLRVHGRPSAAPRCSRPIRWAISPLAGRSAS